MARNDEGRGRYRLGLQKDELQMLKRIDRLTLEDKIEHTDFFHLVESELAANTDTNVDMKACPRLFIGDDLDGLLHNNIKDLPNNRPPFSPSLHAIVLEYGVDDLYGVRIDAFAAGSFTRPLTRSACART